MRKIKDLYNELGVKRRRFSHLLGVTEKTVERWESGETAPQGAALAFVQFLERNSDITPVFIQGIEKGLSLLNPTGGSLRGKDNWGSGSYDVPRGHRKHKGIDLIGVDGQDIIAPIGGKIRVGRTYETGIGGASDIDPYELVAIRAQNVIVRLLYISPSVKNGDFVETGDKIGNLQSLQRRYKDITDHVHLDMRIDDKNVDPTPYI